MAGQENVNSSCNPGLFPQVLMDEANISVNGARPDNAKNDETSFRKQVEERISQKIQAFDTPYQSNTETLPNMAAYHPSFTKVEDQYEILLHTAIEMLENSKYADDLTKRLLDTSFKQRKVRYPQERVVGLVGDSGVGKSSLMNAILDTPGLALTVWIDIPLRPAELTVIDKGANGSACTCVITEYRCPWPFQQTAFKAEIALFDQARIMSILKEHLRDYFFANVDDEGSADMDATKDARHQSDTAVEVLQALFADHVEFRDRITIQAFLGQMQSPEDEAVLNTLLQWIENLISRSGAVNRLIYRSAESSSNLGKSIEPFIKMGPNLISDVTPSLWPIVEVVRIGLQAPLLERGIVLADLPGLSDLNQTRTSSTNKYTHSCDYLFLVAPIARVQTDNLVDKRILEYTQRFGSRIALICTKTDDTPEHADPRDFLATERASSEHRQLKRTHEEMGIRKIDLTKTKKVAKGAEKAALGQELNDLSLRRRICEVLLKESVVLMRNRKVETAMRLKHRVADTPSEALKVWCVSSTEYNINVDGFDDETIPISVEATGVPQLRAFILRVPAEEKLKILKLYCWSHLESLIASMEMWGVQSTILRRLEAREVVAKPRKLAEEVIFKLSHKIKTHLDCTILDATRDLKSGWIEQGLQHLEKIAKEARWTTLRAWCRHNGKHSTPIHPDWNWNDGFLQPVLNEMRKPWQKYDQACDKASTECLTALTSLLDGIRGELGAIDDVVVIPLEPFMKSLAPRKLLLQNMFQKFSAKVRRFGNGVKMNVITSDTEDSYLLKALIPVYQKCGKLAGHKSSHRRIAMLEATFRQGAPFAEIEPGLKAMLEKDLDERISKLVEKVQKVFDMVLIDFDSMFSVQERPNVDRDTLRNAISEFVAKAQATLHGPMAMELAKAVKESD